MSKGINSNEFCSRDDTFEEMVRELCCEMELDVGVVFYTTIDTGDTGDLDSSHFSYLTEQINLGDIVVRNVYENDLMTELSLHKQVLPAALITIFRQLMPPSTRRLVMKRCIMNDGACLGSLVKLLQTTAITDVTLDGTPLHYRAYYSLLEDTRLRNLSLARCSIDDEAVKEMMLRLRPGSSCGDHLQTLNLSGNCLTDDGAKYVAEALMFNMTLLYLNLSGNYIGDDGGNAILDALDVFKPPDEHMIECRNKHLAYLKRKQSGSSKKSSLVTKKSQLIKKADSKVTLDQYVSKTLEPFSHPFMEENVFVKDDIYWCYGNRILSYLNLAYNKLSYVFLLKLKRVLESQQSTWSAKRRGLATVVIEGNNLPRNCTELDTINKIFLKKCCLVRQSKHEKKNSSTAREKLHT